MTSELREKELVEEYGVVVMDDWRRVAVAEREDKERAIELLGTATNVIGGALTGQFDPVQLADFLDSVTALRTTTDPKEPDHD